MRAPLRDVQRLMLSSRSGCCCASRRAPPPPPPPGASCHPLPALRRQQEKGVIKGAAVRYQNDERVSSVSAAQVSSWSAIRFHHFGLVVC